MTAHIFQINISDGGVPKRSVARAEVTAQGIVGDRQRNRRVHGGPRRALCLFSLEAILALQQEGHPIYPGAIGENVTIAGLDWRQVMPGVILRLGQDVRLRVTSYTTPCSNIAGAFRQGAIDLVLAKTAPQHARVYVEVLQEGAIQPGDPVIFES